MDDAQPRLAATVLLVRDNEAGPQIFMVRRHQKSKFMANAHVFVGGRLDDEDAGQPMAARVRGLSAEQAASRLGLDDLELALGLYVAAIRETFEESGVLLAEDEGGTPARADALSPMRDRLNDRQRGFALLLAEAGLYAALGRLRYLAHWITPAFEPRRFDTYFFLCVAPAGQQASYDQRETTAGEWFTVGRVLAANRDQELLLPPPTLCVLESLAEASSVSELVALAPDEPVAPIQPRPLLKSEGQITLLLPDDHRYNDQHSSKGSEDYVVLVDGYWRHVVR